MVLPYALQDPQLEKSGRQNPHCFLAKKIPVPFGVCNHSGEKEQGLTWENEQNCQCPWAYALSLLLGNTSLNNHKGYSALSSPSAQMLSRKKSTEGSERLTRVRVWQSWNQSEGYSFLNQGSSAHPASLSGASFASSLVEFLRLLCVGED